MCVADRNREKFTKNPYFVVQGHSRSSMLTFLRNSSPELVMINSMSVLSVTFLKSSSWHLRGAGRTHRQRPRPARRVYVSPLSPTVPCPSIKCMSAGRYLWSWHIYKHHLPSLNVTCLVLVARMRSRERSNLLWIICWLKITCVCITRLFFKQQNWVFR